MTSKRHGSGMIGGVQPPTPPVVETPEEFLRKKIKLAVLIHQHEVVSAKGRLASALRWATTELEGCQRDETAASDARALASNAADAAAAIAMLRAHRDALKSLQPIVEAAGLSWDELMANGPETGT